MAQSKRQRRKQRQHERQEREAGGVAEELREEADAPPMPGDEEAEQVTVTGPGEEGERTFAEAEAELYDEIEDDVGPAELIAAIPALRRTRRHSLLPGIRMFTALLEEARGGYAHDRLAQLEEALGLEFNRLESEGILQVSMAMMDGTGVPDVEHGVRIALEARAQLDTDEILEEDRPEDDLPPEDDDAPPAAAEGAYQPQSEEAKRLAATGAPDVDVKAMDAAVAEREAEDRETAEPDEDPDADAPGPDEQ